jgi:hypothetical protein
MTHSASHSPASVEPPLFDSYEFYGSDVGSPRMESVPKKALSLPFGKVNLPAVAAALALAPVSERTTFANPTPARDLAQAAAAA